MYTIIYIFIIKASRDECARAAAVLRWTLKQAHRCGCSGVQLARDLLVLGVPRAHASALADAAETGREAYESHVKANGFMSTYYMCIVINNTKIN